MPAPVFELFQHMQELFKTPSSSRNRFYFENLISIIFFPYGTFAYFLLVFTSIILSGLISEVVFTFFRVYRCLLKVSTLKIIPLLRKKLMLLLKSN